jgi:TolA-binding protein
MAFELELLCCTVFVGYTITVFLSFCKDDEEEYEYEYEDEDEDEDEDEEKEEEEEEKEEEKDIYMDMNEVEDLLKEQYSRLKQMNDIEELSNLIEMEKEKGDLRQRLTTIENKKLIYKFHINDFNQYRNAVYEEFKNNSRCKKQSFIMKKIGQSWKDLTDDQKLNFKNT